MFWIVDKGGDLNDEDDMLIDIHIAERERKQELDEKRKQKPKYHKWFVFVLILNIFFLRYDVYAAADGTNTSLLSQYDEEKKGDILTVCFELFIIHYSLKFKFIFIFFLVGCKWFCGYG